MNQLIDTHAHLTWDSFQPDLETIVDRAVKAGLKTVINVGADLESSIQAAKLDCQPLNSYSTIGLHPQEASKFTSPESIHKNVKKLEEICQIHSGKVVAVGECGLDYYFAGGDYFPTSLSQEKQIKLQRELFQAQIALAKKLNLPLIIHSRDCGDDIFLPELANTRGVFHSFTGTKEKAKKVLDLGYYLGFNCTVTYPKNEHLRGIIKSTPIDKILTETDCPFLPPQTKRGQRCEPADIVEVVKVIAQIKNLPYEKVAEVIFQNARKLFKLA